MRDAWPTPSFSNFSFSPRETTPCISLHRKDPGYEPLITHLFEKRAEHLDSDVVFGAKSKLVAAFERRRPGSTPDGRTCDVPWLLATYDFVLRPKH